MCVSRKVVACLTSSPTKSPKHREQLAKCRRWPSWSALRSFFVEFALFRPLSDPTCVSHFYHVPWASGLFDHKRIRWSLTVTSIRDQLWPRSCSDWRKMVANSWINDWTPYDIRSMWIVWNIRILESWPSQWQWPQDLRWWRHQRQPMYSSHSVTTDTVTSCIAR